MLGRLFLLFTIVPAVELYLLIRIGEWLGGAATLGLVLLTGALGAALARAEGMRVLRDYRAAIAAGRPPADGVVSGMLVLLGGVLLITPGVLTDAAGLLLLVPFVRRPVARYVVHRIEAAIERGTVQVVHSYARYDVYGGGGRPYGEEDIIDVEGETVSSHRVDSHHASLGDRGEYPRED